MLTIAAFFGGGYNSLTAPRNVSDAESLIKADERLGFVGDDNDRTLLIVADQKDQTGFEGELSSLKNCPSLVCALPRASYFGLIYVIRCCFYGKEMDLSTAVCKVAQEQEMKEEIEMFLGTMRFMREMEDEAIERRISPSVFWRKMGFR